MKTKIKTALIAMFTLVCALTTQAQGMRTTVLADNHVMVRVPVTEGYLLLPVEEMEGVSHLRVIQNNRCVQELNVRLAASRVDYFVPLRIDRWEPGNLTIDINVNRGDASSSASKAATSDFICWKQMRRSKTFDTANRERFRPLYHHTPTWGWMNDPNGMFYKDSVWHVYYQHNPYGSRWENMTWGHSTSTDLIHWKFEGEAIEPDAFGSIFSGCSVVDSSNTAGFGQGAIVSYYTSARQAQKQCMAYSLDNGKTFTKYADNPVLLSDVADFRDPHIFWHAPNGRWVMVVAEKQHMKIFSSKDLKDWTFESDFGEGYGSHAGVWECPDLLDMGNGKWILLCNINPGGPFGGSATQYFTGQFDGHRFTCDSQPDERKWLDWGKDHYATVTFNNAPGGRHVALPWMSNWQYAAQVPTKQYRSANGIPREIGYYEYQGKGYASVKPAREVMQAFSTKKQKTLTEACRVDISLRSNAVITLSNRKGEQVVMTYSAADETFTMDRTHSGDTSFNQEFACQTTAPTHGKIKKLQLFIDKSSIEAFDADGKMAMSNIVFPSMPYSHLSVKGGRAAVYPLK